MPDNGPGYAKFILDENYTDELGKGTVPLTQNRKNESFGVRIHEDFKIRTAWPLKSFHRANHIVPGVIHNPILLYG